MKKRKFILSILILFIFSTTTILASNYSETIVRNFHGIRIKLNGKEIIPKDANGNLVEPFTIDGTTYLPVRAIAEALDLEVEWDGEKNIVILNQHTKHVAQPKEYNYAQNPGNSDVESLERIDIVKLNTSSRITQTQKINIGEKLKLDVLPSPSNAEIGEIEWSSNNTHVASVNSLGTVTGKNIGTATIKAKENITGFFYTIKIQVTEDESSTVIPESSSVSNSQSKAFYENYGKGTIQSKMNASGLLDSSITTNQINSALEEIRKTPFEKLESAVYTTKGNTYYHSIDCSNLNGTLISYMRYKAIAQNVKACPYCKP